MAEPADTPDGHPVLDSLIARYRESLGRDTKRSIPTLRVLQIWELAAQTATEDEALQFVSTIDKLSIDHYRAFKPEPARFWDIAARRRNRRLSAQVQEYLVAAGHASTRYFYMVKTYPGVQKTLQDANLPARNPTTRKS